MFKFKFFGAKRAETDSAPRGYIKPTYACSSLILLCGPAYGDKTFLASFLLDVTKAKSWMREHANSVFSTSKLEQEARCFLPTWCEKVTNDNNDYVSLIDIHMRHVLVPYTYDFYLKDFLRIYCHSCHSFCNKLVDTSSDVASIGQSRIWIEEWQCPIGHILHSKNQELRLLNRRS